jgi:hypothetical protein
MGLGLLLMVDDFLSLKGLVAMLKLNHHDVREVLEDRD